ncbi:MAG TPA: FtsX-like permease family protein, partial [Blastocatellia bacterium]|nr:FtsX-like permease family protein [Blastocatellia bacterium]
DLAMASVRALDAAAGAALAGRRFTLLLVGLFAVTALLLAGVGIYGVMAYLVAQRTHEIGIRMALGARTGNVLRVVIGQGMRMTLIGIGAGLAAAFALTRAMSSLLFAVAPTDPLTFAAVAVFLAAVALAACFIPARRAAKVDPMVALRYE